MFVIISIQIQKKSKGTELSAIFGSRDFKRLHVIFRLFDLSAFPQSHARSAFCSDWWINCCLWRWGNCRCLCKGIKKALGAEDWPPTVPTTAPPRQLPTGWRSKLCNASCTSCEAGVSASWHGAGSDHRGGMRGKWWHTAWAAVEQATQPEFSRCKSNRAPVCGSPQWKSQMYTFTAWSWCRQRKKQRWYWSDSSLRSSCEWAPWSCPIAGWVRCQQRPRHDRQWSNASIRRSWWWAAWSCPISGWVRCQQRPRHDRQWSNASLHSSSGRASWSCPISGWVGCQHGPRPDRQWSNASFRCCASGAAWSCPISGGVGCQQRPRHDRQRSKAFFHCCCIWPPCSCPISGWVGCQPRPMHDRWWSNASFHSCWERAP